MNGQRKVNLLIREEFHKKMPRGFLRLTGGNHSWQKLQLITVHNLKAITENP